MSFEGPFSQLVDPKHSVHFLINLALKIFLRDYVDCIRVNSDTFIACGEINHSIGSLPPSSFVIQTAVSHIVIIVSIKSAKFATVVITKKRVSSIPKVRVDVKRIVNLK